MKISEKTMGVLNNFQSINASILLKPGNTIKTMSDDRAVLAEASIDETVEHEFGIYDLSQFINNVSTLGLDTDIDIDGNVASIKNGSFSVSYRACKPALISSPPDKELPMDNVVLRVTLQEDHFKKFIKLASMNGMKNIVLAISSGKMYIRSNDGSDTSNQLENELGDTDLPDVEVKFLTQHFKLIPGTYKVEATDRFARFTSEDDKLKYYIVAQQK